MRVGHTQRTQSRRLGMAWLVAMTIVVLIGACVPRVPTSTAPPPVQFPSATRGPSNTPQPTPTPLTRRTLPASWTPMIPTMTFDMMALPRDATNVPELCDSFLPDFERNRPTFNLGMTPEIYWLMIPTASIYRVRLYDPQGELIFADDASGDVYVFPPTVFTQPEAYGWEVIPLDTDRNQLCQPVGSVLLGSFVPGDTPVGT